MLILNLGQRFGWSKSCHVDQCASLGVKYLIFLYYGINYIENGEMELVLTYNVTYNVNKAQ